MAVPERLLYIEVTCGRQSGPEFLAVLKRVVALWRWSLMEVPLYVCLLYIEVTCGRQSGPEFLAVLKRVVALWCRSHG